MAFQCMCGGEMIAKSYEEYLKESLATMGLVVSLKPPYHRKKRIRKKWAKQHARKTTPFIALAGWMVPVRRGVGHYRCTRCGHQDGGYSFLARQMFQVEPMPGGALPYYDRDEMSDDEKRAFVEKVLSEKR